MVAILKENPLAKLDKQRKSIHKRQLPISSPRGRSKATKTQATVANDKDALLLLQQQQQQQQQPEQQQISAVGATATGSSAAVISGADKAGDKDGGGGGGFLSKLSPRSQMLRKALLSSLSTRHLHQSKTGGGGGSQCAEIQHQHQSETDLLETVLAKISELLQIGT